MPDIKLSKQLVKDIAKLSRISLRDDELSEYEKKLNEVLEYVKVLDEVDTDSDTSKPETRGQLREDIVKSGLTQAQALSNAPKTERGYFRVDGSLSEQEDA